MTDWQRQRSERTARLNAGSHYASINPISIHELPYPTTRLEVRSLWHERHEGDPSQAWLHEVMRRATEQLRHKGSA
jgi:hypothetical protein